MKTWVRQGYKLELGPPRNPGPSTLSLYHNHQRFINSYETNTLFSTNLDVQTDVHQANSRTSTSPLKEISDEEGSEWEEVECTGGSDCEECRRSNFFQQTSPGTPSSNNPVNAPAPPPRNTVSNAVPPTPPSAGGLLSRKYRLPSPPGANQGNYYCTTQLCGASGKFRQKHFILPFLLIYLK